MTRSQTPTAAGPTERDGSSSDTRTLKMETRRAEEVWDERGGGLKSRCICCWWVLWMRRLSAGTAVFPFALPVRVLEKEFTRHHYDAHDDITTSHSIVSTVVFISICKWQIYSKGLAAVPLKPWQLGGSVEIHLSNIYRGGDASLDRHKLNMSMVKRYIALLTMWCMTTAPSLLHRDVYFILRFLQNRQGFSLPTDHQRWLRC